MIQDACFQVKLTYPFYEAGMLKVRLPCLEEALDKYYIRNQGLHIIVITESDLVWDEISCCP
jgi:hypothetical protein